MILLYQVGKWVAANFKSLQSKLWRLFFIFHRTSRILCRCQAVPREPVAAHGHMNGWTAVRQDGMSEAKALENCLTLLLFFEEFRTEEFGALYGLRVKPSGDFLMVSAKKDIRNFPALEISRACINRRRQ